jgi:hypothetical protein
MPAERVVIRHPDTGNTSTVTERAFERAWSKQGWERVTADVVRKDELVEVATDLGVDTDGTKAEILDRIEHQEN